jgi:NAD(P)-dependent dehydrogenase (short-subunit alcohol dehydrogenase family)
MDLQLSGKRALVTGGSRGIGLQVARSLRAEGAHVAIAARDPRRLAEAAATLAAGTPPAATPSAATLAAATPSAATLAAATLAAATLAAAGTPGAAGVGTSRGGRVVTVEIETGDDDSVTAAVARVVRELGGIDILVNGAAEPNGGAAPIVPSRTTDQQFWDAVNVKKVGYLRTARAVAPGMVAQGWGRIINVSGLAARQAGDFVATARNVGVAALTKNLADELGPYGVNVTVVHPGMTITERSPATFARMAEASGTTAAEVERQAGARTAIGRLPTAEEVAWVITFLASPRSVAMTGDPVVVGGGAPGPVYY